MNEVKSNVDSIAERLKVIKEGEPLDAETALLLVDYVNQLLGFERHRQHLYKLSSDMLDALGIVQNELPPPRSESIVKACRALRTKVAELEAEVERLKEKGKKEFEISQYVLQRSAQERTDWGNSQVARAEQAESERDALAARLEAVWGPATRITSGWERQGDEQPITDDKVVVSLVWIDQLERAILDGEGEKQKRPTPEGRCPGCGGHPVRFENNGKWKKCICACGRSWTPGREGE